MIEIVLYYLDYAWESILYTIYRIGWFAQQSPTLTILAVIVLGLLCKLWVTKNKHTIY